MRLSLIFLLSLLVFSCGPTTSPDAPAVDTPAPETTEQNETEDPDDQMISRGMEASEAELTGEAAQLAAIRRDFVRIQEAKEAGTLRKDSIPYNCEYAMIQGDVVLYSDDRNVVLAIHSFTQGDHSGATEHYYFRDGKPVFFYRESGVWHFGGEIQTLDDGTQYPGTIDIITEDRLYIHQGSTIKALTKEYEIRNGEDVDPTTIPNETLTPNGGLPESLDFVQSAFSTKKLDCKLIEE